MKWRITLDRWRQPVLWIYIDALHTVARTPSNYKFKADYDWQAAWERLLASLEV